MIKGMKSKSYWLEKGESNVMNQSLKSIEGI